MDKSKIELLWVATFPPISNATAAGSKTFYYYFNSFRNDERFNLRLVTCANNKERSIIQDELYDVHHSIVFWPDNIGGKLRNLINIESKFNPLNRNGGLISNTDFNAILKTLRKWKTDNYFPDVVILEWTNMVVIAPQIHKIFPNTKIVASEHDVTFIGYSRKSAYYNKGLSGKYWKIKALHEKKTELMALSYCDLVVPQNSENIQTLIENGLKKEKISSIVPYFHNMEDIVWTPKNNDILFFGAMGRQENSLSAIWFIKNVMPLLKNTPCRFVILGSNPNMELKSYESDKIHITGFVESIDDFFKYSLCLVAPLVLGAGIKVKVLEGLSAGIPVLTNDIGIEGIPATKNQDFYYCVKPEDYADVIRKLVNERDSSMGQNAKNMIQESFSVDRSVEHYKDSIVDLLGGVR